MNKTSETKRGWRILRRILVALAILVTLIAVIYAEEDWRGKRADAGRIAQGLPKSNKFRAPPTGGKSNGGEE